MRKALIPFLVLGLLLLGVSPAMAAGEQVKAALPAQQDEVVQVVVPGAQHLSDSDLEQIRGENPILVAFAVGVAAGVVGNIIYEKWVKPRLFPKPKPKPQKCKCKCSCEAEASCPADR